MISPLNANVLSFLNIIDLKVRIHDQYNNNAVSSLDRRSRWFDNQAPEEFKTLVQKRSTSQISLYATEQRISEVERSPAEGKLTHTKAQL